MVKEITRIAIGVEYEGTAYKGFQKQKSTSQTIQGLIDKALSQVADQKIKSVCSGRTDAGVHAYCQTIHFDTTSSRKNKAWVQGGNSLLPKDIRFIWAQKVNNNFHSRFSAISRTYRYIIRNSSFSSALNRNRHLWIKEDLDLQSMRRASSYLIGDRDFTSFRSSSCQSKSSFRNIYSIKIKKKGELILIDITANAFLLNMVRIIVGTLLEVGRKKVTPNKVKSILDAKDRKLAGKTASPEGLYFVGTNYEEKFKLLPV
tara:strand:+ start:1378 stop:2154 length:777 start_codon:yes stop_codon:yes gene_type:complete